MSKVVNEVVAANQAYAKTFGAKGELPLPPARQFAILTCMDARLDPAKYAGLAEGDAQPVYGYVYDVRTGRLNEVKAATEAGKAKTA
jgi:carbonic anhydrase